jgi:hypothetical protein
MNTKDNSEMRELEADELNKVTGSGGVKIPRPPIGPAVLPTTPSPTPPVTGTGGGEGGGGGDGAFYGDPHRLD